MKTLSRSFSAGRRKLVIGIRREDPKRIWERRAPLTPQDVAHILSTLPVKVQVAPCHRRVFSAEEYQKAGASITSDLSNADIVLGIKETPLDELDRISRGGQTHLMFSHTHKGQAYNTPLLSRFVGPTEAPRLIDYELLTDTNGQRTVGFGWFAGVAGVLESLSSMAHSHLEHGISSPFLYTPRPHTTPSLSEARLQLANIGSLIATHGTPSVLGPFVIGLTGRGNVSQGCLSMLSELPIQQVRVDDLPALIADPATDLRKVYLVHVRPEEYLVTVDGRPYSRDLYYASPQSFKSTFHERVAPYLTLFLNGTGWSPSFPRLMTNEQLPLALSRASQLRFTNIGDISCDIEGGLEFLTKPTTLCSPSYKVRPSTLNPSHPSITMMSVDILPASMPLDASNHFSNVLQPYVASLVSSLVDPASNGTLRTDRLHSEDEHMQSLDRATIAQDGKLKEAHKWLQPAVDKFYASSADGPTPSASPSTPTKSTHSPGTTSKPAPPANPPRAKRILILGSGMVAKPAVDTIASHPGMELIVASNSLPELQSLTSPHPHVKYRIVDIFNDATYRHLIEECDVVVSLLPVPLHPPIARACISLGKHLVTASYISPEMAALDESAKQADVLLMNEIGLDPGIDHCSAIDLLERLKAEGKQVLSFTSLCGGLPSPSASHVPLRYKFSWRPQGVLLATANEAIFKLGGEIHTVPGSHLLHSSFSDIPIPGGKESWGGAGTLEMLPNRDSLKYSKTYDLPLNEMRTLMRGTLRYPGFSSLMSSFVALGLLDTSATIHPDNWRSFVRLALSNKYPTHNKKVPELKELVTADVMPELVEALRFLGLVPSASSSVSSTSPTSAMPPLPSVPTTPLDLLAYLLSSKLRYAPHERDMVVLTHEIVTAPRTQLAAWNYHRALQAGFRRQSLNTANMSSNLDTIDENGNVVRVTSNPYAPTPSAEQIYAGENYAEVYSTGKLFDPPQPPLEEIHTSTLISEAVPSLTDPSSLDSAMSRTVSLPLAFTAIAIALGHVPSSLRGVHGPGAHPSIYGRVLDGLAGVGLGMVERVRRGAGVIGGGLSRKASLGANHEGVLGLWSGARPKLLGLEKTVEQTLAVQVGIKKQQERRANAGVHGEEVKGAKEGFVHK